MLITVDGNSDHVAHVWSKIGIFEIVKISKCSLSNQMP